MIHDPAQLEVLARPIRDLSASDVAALTHLAKALDASAWRLTPTESPFAAPPRHPRWVHRQDPHRLPPVPRPHWPLPERAQGYARSLDLAALCTVAVELVHHAGTNRYFLASRTYHDQAFRIGRAYCLLGYLPPYEVLARLLQETHRPSAMGMDLLLVEAGMRTLARVHEMAQLLQHALQDLRARLHPQLGEGVSPREHAQRRQG